MECSENKEKGIQKYRDIAMRWKGDTELSILACENQEKVHYAMPVRMMLYDSLSYVDQMRQIWNERDDTETLTGDEFLSRFRKDDKIYPVISLVFYYGLKPWDGSCDLYGMFQRENMLRSNEIFRNSIPNYKINLIDVGNPGQLENFRSDLQVILGMLQYREQKEEIQEYIEKHRAYFEKIDAGTYQAIRELLHSEKQLKNIDTKNKGEQTNMCKALEAIFEDGVAKGKLDGMAEGQLQLLKTQLKLGMISTADAAKCMNISLDEFQALLNEKV